MRPLTHAVRNAIRNKSPTVQLAYFDFPAGEERFWNGVGTLQYDGFAWKGLGGLASISGVSSDASTFIQTINFTLAVDAQTILTVEDDIRGREAKAWLAFLDDHGQIVPDPIEIVSVEMDIASHQIDGDQQRITITGQTAFFTLEAPARFLWTNEQQQSDFPGDTGWDRAPGNATKEVTWSPP